MSRFHRFRPSSFGLVLGLLLGPLAAVGGTSIAAPPPADLERPYAGDRVVRVTIRGARDLRAMLALSEDAWSHRLGLGPCDFRLSPEAYRALQRSGLPFEVLIEDVQRLVDAERARLAAAEPEGGVAGLDFFADFRDLATINARLDELAAVHPDRASVIVIGTSVEGRSIRGIEIRPEESAGLPQVVINFAQHAREWATPMTGMWLVEALLERSDPAVAAVADAAIWTVIPVTNPDGYEHSWGPERLWRKNRRPNPDGSIGVDLNRNWGWGWGGQGSSGSPSSETYRGPSAFSEPETAALRDFLSSRSDLAAHLDIHSYGQWILHPWGNVATPTPDAAAFALMSSEIAGAIRAVHGRTYVAGSIYSTLYPASGGACDWVYGDRGAFSFTFEVRDTGSYGFVMPPSEIVPNAEENLAGIAAFARVALSPAAFVAPQIPAQVPAGEEARVPVSIVPIRGEVTAGSEVAWIAIDDGAAATVPLVALGSNQFEVPLPAVACGRTIRWWLEAETSLGMIRLPSESGLTAFVTEAVIDQVAFADDFELDRGWTVGATGDNATAGLWTRVAPVGTIAQPGSDHSPDGILCFVTGQHVAGQGAGTSDVDNGITSLTSPLFDASDPATEVRVWLWHSNNQGANPGTDSMLVQASSGDGTWVLVDEILDSPGVWFERRWRLADFLPPSATCRIRFVARDLGAGSLVEAAVDDFAVVVPGCPAVVIGDLDGNGVVEGADLALLLGAWGTAGGPADLDDDGTVGGSDLAVLLGNWS